VKQLTIVLLVLIVAALTKLGEAMDPSRPRRRIPWIRMLIVAWLFFHVAGFIGDIL
jgi:hypothetical protein